MNSNIKQNTVLKRRKRYISPYSTFRIRRNNCKRGEKSLVGATIIERPSWSGKKNER